MRYLAGCALLLALIATSAVAAEAPMLADLVASGKLPPEAERLPEKPLVVVLDESTERSVGQRGGSINMLMGGQNDIRMMTVYGYARLVKYDRNLDLQPDILLSYENEGNRIYTFHLRPGHKWSDGSPFTAEDFRYQWEDYLTNPAMEFGALEPALFAEGKPPRFEVIDPLTVRYSWDTPNPLFLPALAGARPLDIYAASEQPIEGVSAEALAARMRSFGHRAVTYSGDLDNAVEGILSVAAEGDAVMTLGAGNVWQAGDKILGRLKGGA